MSRPSLVKCVDCGNDVAVKSKGPIPKRCAPCAKADHCRKCTARLKANPERQKIYKRRCYEKHINEYRAAGRKAANEWYARNRDRVLARLRNKTPEQRLEQARYQSQLRARRVDEVRKAERARYANDTTHRISKVLRARIRSLVIGKSSAGSLVRDLGTTIEHFRDHIERQFSKGMSWSNYGTAWELDHIYPLSKADLTDRVHFLAVANYRNYQPLPPAENYAKKDFVSHEAQELFDRLVSEARGKLDEKAAGEAKWRKARQSQGRQGLQVF